MAKKYYSLEKMLREFGGHEWELDKEPSKIPDPNVTFEGQDVRVTTTDGIVFEADARYFKKWDRKVYAHPKAKLLLTQACICGEIWSVAFSPQNKDCPPELYFRS